MTHQDSTCITVGVVKEEENKLTNQNADGRQPFVCRCSALCGAGREAEKEISASPSIVDYGSLLFPSFVPSFLLLLQLLELYFIFTRRGL